MLRKAFAVQNMVFHKFSQFFPSFVNFCFILLPKRAQNVLPDPQNHVKESEQHQNLAKFDKVTLTYFFAIMVKFGLIYLLLGASRPFNALTFSLQK